MTETSPHPRIIRKRENSAIPLSKLRISDAIKIISDSPRRMEELLRMLEDRDRGIRDRAAATLAQLASIHPSRLLSAVPRFREALMDESAYVRWHLVYTVGVLCARYHSRLQAALPDLLGCLDDSNRIVRIMASKALAQVAVQNPGIIEELFRSVDKELPPVIAAVLRNPPTKSSRMENHP